MSIHPQTFAPHIFGQTDFKYVDNMPDNQMLKGLKVWPVTEIVTYGFHPSDAPLELGGTHLKPADFHAAMESPDTVVIDVRNANETAIGKSRSRSLPPGTCVLSLFHSGKFMPPENGAVVLDPLMRRSTEFPKYVL